MKQYSYFRILIVILTLYRAALAQQTQPSTQPGLDYLAMPPSEGMRQIFNIAGFRANFTISPDVDFAQAQAELPSLLALAWTREAVDSSHVLWINPDSARSAGNAENRTIQIPCSLDSLTSDPELFHAQSLESMKATNSVEQAQLFRKLAEEKRQELAGETVRRLKQLVTSDPPMSPQQRKARLAKVESDLALAAEKMKVLETLTKVPPQNTTDQLSAKISSLRQKEDDLQMKLSSLQARRVALERGLNDLKKQAQEQRKDDPKLAYLQASIDLKQTIYNRKTQAPGAFSQAEIEEARADVVQAKAALAVAQAEAAKGARGELMDRLSNELATISIDFTDLEIQVRQIHDMLSNYDLANLNEANLDQLVKTDSGFAAAERAKLPPLYFELQKQSNDLRREKLMLIVDDVNLVTETPQRP